jgi:hypothetical protein
MALVVYGGNIDCIQHVVEITNMILQLIYDDAYIYLLLTCLSFANPPSIMMNKVCLETKVQFPWIINLFILCKFAYSEYACGLAQ